MRAGGCRKPVGTTTALKYAIVPDAIRIQDSFSAFNFECLVCLRASKSHLCRLLASSLGNGENRACTPPSSKPGGGSAHFVLHAISGQIIVHLPSVPVSRSKEHVRARARVRLPFNVRRGKGASIKDVRKILRVFLTPFFPPCTQIHTIYTIKFMQPPLLHNPLPSQMRIYFMDAPQSLDPRSGGVRRRSAGWCCASMCSSSAQSTAALPEIEFPLPPSLPLACRTRITCATAVSIGSSRWTGKWEYCESASRRSRGMERAVFN